MQQHLLAKSLESMYDKNEIKEIPQSLVEDQGITDFINEVQLYNSRKHLESKNINPDEVYIVYGAALFMLHQTYMKEI